MNKTQYRKVLAAVKKSGATVAPGSWGIENLGRRFQTCDPACTVCPMAALILTSPSTRSCNLGPYAAKLLGTTPLNVSLFILGFDDSRVPVTDSGLRSEWYKAGQRMREELGVS